MEPQLDNAGMIIMNRSAKIPIVIMSVLFFVAISCNFFAIPVAVFADGVNADQFKGFFDNTAIYTKLASMLRVK